MARLQLNLSETHHALILKIMKQTGVDTKTDVVEDSLLLLAWAVEKAGEGLTIAALDDARGVRQEPLLRTLAGARANALSQDRQPAYGGAPAPARGYAAPPASAPAAASMPMAAMSAGTLPRKG